MLSDVVEEPASGWHDAVVHRGGPLLVLGVAGSGKTQLVQERFCHLVGDGERPERILIVAPTAARVDGLREGIEARLERGYEELHALRPAELAALALASVGADPDVGLSTLSAGDRLAMLIERIDELSLQHHDFGGSANALLGGFIRRIDRLKAELITAEEYEAWARDGRDPAEQEFAALYLTHERMLAEAAG